MTRTRSLPLALGLAAAALLPLRALASSPTPGTSTPPPLPPVIYNQFIADRTDPTAAPAWAAATRTNCKGSACNELVISSDGGHAWAPVSGSGWDGSAPVVVSAAGRQLLVAPGQSSAIVSRDGGRSFTPLSGSGSGPVDALPSADGKDAVAITNGSGGALVTSILTGNTRKVAGSSLTSASYTLTGDPSMPALASGQDPTTGFPVVQQCFATYACSGSGTVVTHKDSARLFVSPHFADDHVVLASTSHGFLASTDAGASWKAIVILTPTNTPGLLITTVPAIAFTPDFDASRHVGRIYAALFAVTGQNGQPGSTTGGVYASSDTASWTKVSGGTPLDHGVQALAVIGSGHIIASWAAASPSAPMSMGTLCSSDRATSWLPTCPGTGADGGTSGGTGQAGGSHGSGSTAAGAGASTSPDAVAGSTGGGGPASGPSSSRLAGASSAQNPVARNWALIVAALALAALLGTAAVLRRRAAPGEPED